MPPLNVYTCDEFTGHGRVGTAAVVVASSPEEAAEILTKKLAELNLKQDYELRPAWMVPVDATRPHALILCDGDY